jgi:hypothetical protein
MKHVGQRVPPPEPPAPTTSPDELEPIARIAAMYDGLDGPAQQPVPLSAPGVMERIRHAAVKRRAIFGTDLSEKPKEP